MFIARLLFDLLLFLLPTQLGRHFFFDFSLVFGIRSDYLAPTLYLTDCLVFLLLAVFSFSSLRVYRRERMTGMRRIPFLFFFLFVFFLLHAFFVSTTQWISLYMLGKLTEFFFLGYVVVRLRPSTTRVGVLLCLGGIYSSFLALWQFSLQRSVGGFFWFLGERTFFASTPSIAATSIWGMFFLRPYATFPHPNVLGGFLAVLLPLSLSLRRRCPVFSLGSFVLGSVVLFLSFSRAAWIVAFFGCVMILSGKLRIMQRAIGAQMFRFTVLLFTAIVLSIVLPLFVPVRTRSFSERALFIRQSLATFSRHGVFGVGIGASVASSVFPSSPFSFSSILQPVHNIFLLTLVETGVVGFLLALWGVAFVVFRATRSSPETFLMILQLLVLGLFDHYLLTLQQGQLLFTLSCALAFLRQNSYTHEYTSQTHV